MLEQTLNWWKELKWYWKILGLFVLIGAFVLSMGGRRRNRDWNQLSKLDEQQEIRVDDHLQEQEKRLEKLKKETKKFDDDVVTGQKQLKKIDTNIREKDKDLADLDNPTIEDLNKWRQKYGV